MPGVGGFDFHRKQITFDYLDTATGEVKRGQIAPAGRAHLRSWRSRTLPAVYDNPRGVQRPCRLRIPAMIASG
jgi:hypothetical protein